jgi:hypothetical protein
MAATTGILKSLGSKGPCPQSAAPHRYDVRFFRIRSLQWVEAVWKRDLAYTERLPRLKKDVSSEWQHEAIR